MCCGALPFLIEGMQFFGAAIGRECQSADVFDNLAGLLLGFVVGVAIDVGHHALRCLRNGDHYKR